MNTSNTTLTTQYAPKRGIKAALMVLALISYGAMAQTPPTHSTVPASNPSAAVNPLTGQMLSSEALARELAKAKLEAELSETRVKLAKSQADLALATLRQEAEERRLKNQIKAESASPPTTATLNLPMVVPAPTNRPQNVTSPTTHATGRTTTAPTLSNAPAAEPPILNQAPRAQGTLLIGGERIALELSAPQKTSRIEAVDRQEASRGTGAPQPFARPTANIQTNALPAATTPLVIPPLSME